MPLFDDTKVYRTSDIEGPGQLVPNACTRQSWIENFGFPRGRLTGRLRTWTGAELNAWWESRSSAPMAMPEGFGGAQPGSGRKPQL
jgi:hypothetical protein